jgi:nitrate/TMAO reductase-like tetraheme cytochrome c subunit
LKTVQRSVPLLLAFALLGCEAESEHQQAAMVEPESLPSEAECRECHADVAVQWSRSRHHTSFTNADFQRAYAREPTDFCRNCHAPALVRAEPLPIAEAEPLGVGCLDCHLGEDTLLAGPNAELATAPHPLAAVQAFATQSCARCHEFGFPPDSRRPSGTLMQLTMREHQASAHADRSCADCHLPAGDHSLASTRDPAAIRRALAVVARRDGDDLILELEPRGVGHGFPTGDLYRRLELHAERRIGDQTIATATRYLDRELSPWRFPDGRLNPRFHQPIVDDRLTNATQIRLELAGDPAGGEVVWWIDYERVDARDDFAPQQSTIASEVRLADGRL